MTGKRSSEKLLKLVLSGMFIAVGYVLPFFTGQIPEIGKMLLPMHLPVFLCGMLCGWQWGFAVGLILPLFRSLTVGMPYLYPNAVAMAVELASYGFFSGILWKAFHYSLKGLFASLLSSMILGRALWGIAEALLLSFDQKVFTWQMFFAGSILNSVPGLILQFVLIPLILIPLRKTAMRNGNDS